MSLTVLYQPNRMLDQRTNLLQHLIHVLVLVSLKNIQHHKHLFLLAPIGDHSPRLPEPTYFDKAQLGALYRVEPVRIEREIDSVVITKLVNLFDQVVKCA